MPIINTYSDPYAILEGAFLAGQGKREVQQSILDTKQRNAEAKMEFLHVSKLALQKQAHLNKLDEMGAKADLENDTYKSALAAIESPDDLDSFGLEGVAKERAIKVIDAYKSGGIRAKDAYNVIHTMVKQTATGVTPEQKALRAEEAKQRAVQISGGMKMLDQSVENFKASHAAKLQSLQANKGIIQTQLTDSITSKQNAEKVLREDITKWETKLNVLNGKLNTLGQNASKEQAKYNDGKTPADFSAQKTQLENDIRNTSAEITARRQNLGQLLNGQQIQVSPYMSQNYPNVASTYSQFMQSDAQVKNLNQALQSKDAEFNKEFQDFNMKLHDLETKSNGIKSRIIHGEDVDVTEINGLISTAMSVNTTTQPVIP